MSDELLNPNDEFRKTSIFENYTDMLPVRGLIQLVPGIGPILDGIISLPGQLLKEKRIEKLFCNLYDGLILFNESSIKKDWVQSEEFYDILIQAVDSSAKTRSDEKIKINSMILCNVLTIINNGKFRPEEYLRALEDLTPLETKALMVVYKIFTNPIEPNVNELQHAMKVNWKEELQKECGLDAEDAMFIIKRLERTGFVTEITGMYVGYTGGEYTITASFKRFVEYLQMHPFNKVS